MYDKDICMHTCIDSKDIIISSSLPIISMPFKGSFQGKAASVYMADGFHIKLIILIFVDRYTCGASKVQLGGLAQQTRGHSMKLDF